MRLLNPIFFTVASFAGIFLPSVSGTQTPESQPASTVGSRHTSQPTSAPASSPTSKAASRPASEKNSGPTAAKADEKRFLSRTRRLTYTGLRSGEGYFSSDGRYVVFQSERDPENPFFQIFLLDFETGDTWQVSPGSGKTTCAFFRPGTDELLFSSTHLDPGVVEKQKAEIERRATGKKKRYSWDYDRAMDIFSIHRDGASIKRLTTTEGYDAEASYSPDGSKIVFASIRTAYPVSDLSAEDQKRLENDPAYFAEIYIMNADGTDQRRLTQWAGYDGGPFFSPDGQRIIWRHFDESGMLADIYTMRLDGTDRQRITDFGSMSWAPFFHPSGKYVIFATNKHGFENFELYLVDASGRKEPVRVTATDRFDGLPVFSPDGKKLLWTSDRSAQKRSDLYLAHWDHKAALAALEAAPPRAAATPPVKQDSLEPKDTEKTGAAIDKRPAVKLSEEITAADLKAVVAYLASDKLEGRKTGSDGAKLAAAYLASRLREAGLGPKGDDGDYLASFPFTAGLNIQEDATELKLVGGEEEKEVELHKGFRPLAFSSNGEVEGEVVFAGYGLKAPGDTAKGYDSYGDLDVADKIVLVLRYVPEEVEMKRRQELNLYAGLRYKAMVARERKAKALLVVTGPTSPNSGELAPLSFDTNLAGSGILAATIDLDTAKALFSESGKELEAIQKALDVEDPHADGTLSLPGVKVHLKVELERIRESDGNVVAFLPAYKNPDTAETVCIGAHYDHLGHGKIGNSLAHKGEEGEIHNGADDNASGTAAVLEIAAALAAEHRRHPESFRRNLLVAFWSGEEMGTLGSSYFAQHPLVPLESMAAYVNFDMVGRLKENHLILQGVGSSPAWTPLLEKRNIVAGFDLRLQEDPYLPTDATPFYLAKVPVLNFFTGSHEDYHRPTDDPELLNYLETERISKLASRIVLDLLRSEKRPEYAEVKSTKSQAGGRDTMRAYLGTIPDYAAEGAEGVPLSGVRSDGPADKAGVQGGDIVVELGGQKIVNIYDYTYALDAVRIGKPVKMVVLRKGERLTLEVTPEARK